MSPRLTRALRVFLVTWIVSISPSPGEFLTREDGTSRIRLRWAGPGGIAPQGGWQEWLGIMEAGPGAEAYRGGFFATPTASWRVRLRGRRNADHETAGSLFRRPAALVRTEKARRSEACPARVTAS